MVPPQLAPQGCRAAGALAILATLLFTPPGATTAGHLPRGHEAAATRAPARAAPSPLTGRWKSLPINAPQPSAGAALAWDSADGVIFCFGGATAGGASGDLWAYRPVATRTATAGWTRLATYGDQPVARAGATAVWDSADRVLLVLDGVQAGRESDSLWAYKPGRGGTGPGRWVDVTAQGSPLRRAYHAAAWDSADGVMLVFGGENNGVPLADTWAYRPPRGALAPGTWIQLSASGPAPRRSAMAVWDAADRLMLMAGGQGYRGLLGDLWAFRPRSHGTSGEWTRLAATTPLGARAGAAAAWDPSNRRLLIFGGEVLAPTSPPTTMQSAAPTGPSTSSPAATPSAISTSTATSSPTAVQRGTLLVTAEATYTDDLWSYTPGRYGLGGGRWRLLGSGGPSARSSGAVVDDRDHVLLLDGGQGVSKLGDVWSYRVAGRGAGRWALLDGGSPQAREGEASAWDARHRVWFIFGGFSGTWLNDLWAYTPARGSAGHWTLIPTANGPAPRTEASLVWDGDDGVLLLFGGSDVHGVMNDLWAYRPAGDGTALGRWVPLNAPAAPPARHLHTAVWDGKDREMLVYAGETTLNVLGDLWALRPDLAHGRGNWLQLAAAATPIARFAQAGVWDPVHAQMLVFGGVSGAGSFLDDLWAYHPDQRGGGNAWRYLGSPGVPDGRATAAAAWDPTDGAMLVVGGTGLKSIRNDTYAYRPGAGWSALHPAGPPDRRDGAVSAFDAVNGGLLLFGGTGSSGPLNDLWQLGGVQESTSRHRP